MEGSSWPRALLPLDCPPPLSPPDLRVEGSFQAAVSSHTSGPLEAPVGQAVGALHRGSYITTQELVKVLTGRLHSISCSDLPNQSAESCLEGKAKQREIAVYSQSYFQRPQH